MNVLPYRCYVCTELIYITILSYKVCVFSYLLSFYAVYVYFEMIIITIFSEILRCSEMNLLAIVYILFVILNLFASCLNILCRLLLSFGVYLFQSKSNIVQVTCPNQVQACASFDRRKILKCRTTL